MLFFSGDYVKLSIKLSTMPIDELDEYMDIFQDTIQTDKSKKEP